tara:strand:+ start:487 stop:669 length:183 start_codon:yes stop_codon:yes gene_type:complete
MKNKLNPEQLLNRIEGSCLYQIQISAGVTNTPISKDAEQRAISLGKAKFAQSILNLIREE